MRRKGPIGQRLNIAENRMNIGEIGHKGRAQNQPFSLDHPIASSAAMCPQSALSRAKEKGAAISGNPLIR
jgi:hypothetical protein